MPPRPSSAGGWPWTRTDGPSVLALTRQKLPVLDRTRLRPAADAGAAATSCSSRRPHRCAIVIGTGSEVQLALAAAETAHRRRDADPRGVDAVLGGVRGTGRGNTGSACCRRRSRHGSSVEAASTVRLVPLARRARAWPSGSITSAPRRRRRRCSTNSGSPPSAWSLRSGSRSRPEVRLMSNPLVALGKLGQSPWYDFITRDLVRSGELRRLIEDDGLLRHDVEPDHLREGHQPERRSTTRTSGRWPQAASRRRGRSRPSLWPTSQSACDMFLSGLRADPRQVDGVVSLEVSPTLARDTDGTIAEAERLWKRVAPAQRDDQDPRHRRAGLQAITRCLADGINVNVTLLFSVARYAQVIEAFFRGHRAARRRGRAGGPGGLGGELLREPGRRPDRSGARQGAAIRRNAGAAPSRIANARGGVRGLRRGADDPRWEELAARGAQAQRPLWASTSTKDPKLPRHPTTSTR